MATEPITIEVDAEAARVFKSASDDERQRLAALVSLRLLEVVQPTASLRELMEAISKNAQERGLTPEELRTILDDE